MLSFTKSSKFLIFIFLLLQIILYLTTILPISNSFIIHLACLIVIVITSITLFLKIDFEFFDKELLYKINFLNFSLYSKRFVSYDIKKIIFNQSQSLTNIQMNDGSNIKFNSAKNNKTDSELKVFSKRNNIIYDEKH